MDDVILNIDVHNNRAAAEAVCEVVKGMHLAGIAASCAYDATGQHLRVFIQRPEAKA